jgi:small subunit ribosomal protein S16
MVVKIRLARFGRTNAPFYNIVVTQARYAPCAPPSFPSFDSQPRTYAHTHIRRLTPSTTLL